MSGTLYYKLQELQFELYVARQLNDCKTQRSLKNKIARLEKEIIKKQETEKKGE